jgi:hypothetical protein
VFLIDARRQCSTQSEKNYPLLLDLMLGAHYFALCTKYNFWCTLGRRVYTLVNLARSVAQMNNTDLHVSFSNTIVTLEETTAAMH